MSACNPSVCCSSSCMHHGVRLVPTAYNSCVKGKEPDHREREQYQCIEQLTAMALCCNMSKNQISESNYQLFSSFFFLWHRIKSNPELIYVHPVFLLQIKTCRNPAATKDSHVFVSASALWKTNKCKWCTCAAAHEGKMSGGCQRSIATSHPCSFICSPHLSHTRTETSAHTE